jgi:hypothetical protein
MIWHTTGFDNNPLGQIPEHITQLYGLVLNPMRGRTEEQRFLAASDSRDELVALLKAERVEPYKDENWHRVYRKGGPLEWFNPPWGDGETDDYGNGIIELRRDGWRRVA